VTSFQAKYDRLDILLNNAGIMMNPFELTKDGHESQFQVYRHMVYFATIILLMMTRHKCDMVRNRPIIWVISY
jgi:short-subunit dehydrogenase involved in D-alanine esterification of teichoic acids